MYSEYRMLAQIRLHGGYSLYSLSTFKKVFTLLQTFQEFKAPNLRIVKYNLVTVQQHSPRV